MGVEELYGELMLEPLSLTLPEIAELTDEQILMAVWRASERNKEAKRANGDSERATVTAFDPNLATDDELFQEMRTLGVLLGASEAEIVEQWNLLNPNKLRAVPAVPIVPGTPSQGSDKAPKKLRSFNGPDHSTVLEQPGG